MLGISLLSAFSTITLKLYKQVPSEVSLENQISTMLMQSFKSLDSKYSRIHFHNNNNKNENKN